MRVSLTLRSPRMITPSVSFRSIVIQTTRNQFTNQFTTPSVSWKWKWDPADFWVFLMSVRARSCNKPISNHPQSKSLVNQRSLLFIQPTHVIIRNHLLITVQLVAKCGPQWGPPSLSLCGVSVRSVPGIILPPNQAECGRPPIHCENVRTLTRPGEWTYST